MNPNHYVSLEIAKQLKEAGIKFPENGVVWYRYRPLSSNSNSTIIWYEWDIDYTKNINGRMASGSNICIEWQLIPAPSLSELLDELPGDHTVAWYPKRNKITNELDKVWRGVKPGTIDENYEVEDTEANTAPDAAAKMLLKLLAQCKTLPNLCLSCKNKEYNWESKILPTDKYVCFCNIENGYKKECNYYESVVG